MNKSVLEALMRLFAIVASVDDQGLSPKARHVVYNYLLLQLNQEFANEYISIFDKYLKLHHKKRSDETKVRKRLSLNSVKILTICQEINEELQQREKIIVILRLLEFIGQDGISESERDFVNTVADVFNISQEEYKDIFNFILKEPSDIIHKDRLLIVDNKQRSQSESKSIEYKYIYEKHIKGCIQMLYLPSVNIILMQYRGKDSLLLNNSNVTPRQTYFFETGSVLKNPRMVAPLYYTDILSRFRSIEIKDKIRFLAQDIEFQFPNSSNGLKPFTLYEESGRLVGIMGGSGVGKSTLLSILIGNIKINSGEIKINGYDLYKDNNILDGIIGFVPQDDLLIEELTVFQNLYFNAKLCFRNLNKQQILSLVTKTLRDLDLEEIKKLKVGNALNKYISGGQRKRLNIALELIREPSILFADEPTSGLSSADSETVMSLLKEQTYKGKLVFVNIHQPSSDIYKLFDKIIIMDKGGYPVFYGNPIDAVIYFRRHNLIANDEDAICTTCGNINSEQVLELIENKTVNEFGKLTDERKFSPKKWYELYQKNIKNKTLTSKKIDEHKTLPKVMFKKARKIQQFKIFFTRNILQKVSNLQYILLNVLEAPILALILAFFSKYMKGTPEDPNKYIFAENINIPSYMFMAVTVALFLGLSVSAEEIIKDRRILKREKFLNLSNLAYINSKIVFLIFLSALQTFMFVAIGNFILEIQGLTLKFWLILFSSAVWANILGLIISSALNSVVTIYITIPMILIPQLLFSGTVIDFTKIHPSFAGGKYSPIIGDIMVSRWTYEALITAQFTENEYNKNFFDIEQKIENSTYYSTSYYDKMEELVNYVKKHRADSSKQDFVERRFNIIKSEINATEDRENITFENKDNLNLENFNEQTAKNIINFFFYEVKKKHSKLLKTYRISKDKTLHNLQDVIGKEKVIELRLDNYNKKVDDYVCNKFEFENIKETDHEIIRKYRPVYQETDNEYGRAHFFAAKKKFMGYEIKTMWFNIIFIWLYSLVMYLILISRIFDIDSKLFKNKSVKKIKNKLDKVE